MLFILMSRYLSSGFFCGKGEITVISWPALCKFITIAWPIAKWDLPPKGMIPRTLAASACNKTAQIATTKHNNLTIVVHKLNWTEKLRISFLNEHSHMYSVILIISCEDKGCMSVFTLIQHTYWFAARSVICSLGCVDATRWIDTKIWLHFTNEWQVYEELFLALTNYVLCEVFTINDRWPQPLAVWRLPILFNDLVESPMCTNFTKNLVCLHKLLPRPLRNSFNSFCHNFRMQLFLFSFLVHIYSFLLSTELFKQIFQYQVVDEKYDESNHG